MPFLKSFIRGKCK